MKFDELYQQIITENDDTTEKELTKQDRINLLKKTDVLVEPVPYLISPLQFKKVLYALAEYRPELIYQLNKDFTMFSAEYEEDIDLLIDLMVEFYQDMDENIKREVLEKLVIVYRVPLT